MPFTFHLEQLPHQLLILSLTCRYTFTYGPIFFIQFSTDIDFGEGSAQHDFIYNALKSVNRTTFPWLVVGFHRPYLEPSVSPAFQVISPIPNLSHLCLRPLTTSVSPRNLPLAGGRFPQALPRAPGEPCPLSNLTCV